MKTAAILKVLNPILALLLLNQVASGLLAESLPHEAFEVMHGGGGIALAVAALTHLALNWNWVKTNYLRK